MERRPCVAADDRVEAAPSVHFRQFDEEIVLLDLSSGRYFSLNAVAARMWHELISGKTAAETAAVLTAEYEQDAETILRDCVSLSDELLERGLLRRTS